MRHTKAALLALLITLCCPIAAFSQTALPEPWNQLTDLTDDQKGRIMAIVARTERNIGEAKRRIEAEQTEAHKRSNTPELTRMDIAVRVRDMIRLEKLMERRDIVVLLSPEQLKSAVAAMERVIQTAEILNFEEFTAKQQNDYFCWAASLQMLFSYAGLDWDQEQIADEIKGSSEAQTATPTEISKGATGWRFNFKDPSKNWSAEVRYSQGVPPGAIVVGSMEYNTFVFVELGERHVAVLYKAAYRDTLPERTVETAYIYDPLTGKDIELKWADAASQITGWWSARAEYSASRVF